MKKRWALWRDYAIVQTIAHYFCSPLLRLLPYSAELTLLHEEACALWHRAARVGFAGTVFVGSQGHITDFFHCDYLYLQIQ